MRQFKLQFLALTLTTALFANTLNTETKITPDELEKQNQSNISLIDTLSIKAGYSNANTKITHDNGGVADVNEPESSGAILSLRVVFNNGYIPYFKPYVDFTTISYSDRDFFIPTVGLRHDFVLDEKWIEPYVSFGAGYAFLNRSESPVDGVNAIEDATGSANLTLETGVDFYITKNLALDISLRYDAYNATTTVGGSYKLSTVYDESSLSALVGIVYRFNDGSSDGDDDLDLVVNRKDYCPNTPINAQVDEFGCAQDSDKDGVINLFDECPNTLAGAPVDEKGCALDRDKDGVIALYDRCPDTLKGVPVSECGCPPYKFDFSLTYEFNKYKVENLLQSPTFKVVDFLQKHKDYKVRITGYSDNIGSSKANDKISKFRAINAKRFLTEKGIDKNRVQILSRGKTEALFDNKTLENRTKNRRIFVELYRTDKKVVK